jgi:signal transduction histidine kinase
MNELGLLPISIVCIEDQADDVELVHLALMRAGVAARLTRVDTEAGLASALACPPDLLLCDYSMPGFSAERALAMLAERGAGVPLVVLTRAIGEEAVVNLFRAGAKDYVAKEKMALLPAVIGRVLREGALAAERERTARALADANARLRVLSNHLVHAQERERTRIARDLHDGLGQLLTSIVIQLQAARHTADPAQAERCYANALETAQHSIGQVKTMSFQLRPAQLELLGFVAAVKATLDRQRDATGLQAVVRLRGNPPEHVLPSHAVALRILQEGLTNVLRHAGAARAVVRLRFLRDERFVLTLGDDGCGFDLHAVLAGGMSEKNIGLNGMLERAELMGGRLRFRSRPGRGSTLRLTL